MCLLQMLLLDLMKQESILGPGQTIPLAGKYDPLTNYDLLDPIIKTTNLNTHAPIRNTFI